MESAAGRGGKGLALAVWPSPCFQALQYLGHFPHPSMLSKEHSYAVD